MSIFIGPLNPETSKLLSTSVEQAPLEMPGWLPRLWDEIQVDIISRQLRSFLTGQSHESEKRIEEER